MTYTILVVDDDDDDFILLSSIIKQCHQDVALVYAQSGREATRLLIDGLQPNLMLVDVQMPLMDGYELVVWLMESVSWRHIPVVIWTGEISDDEVTRYYRAGANSLLLKQDAFADVDAFCKYWLHLVRLPQLVWQESRRS